MDHEQFRRWRKRRKLTQVAAAKLLQISVSSICGYETPPTQHGKHRPIPARTVKLIKTLDALARATA